MQAGEATVADLMADDVTWWVPASSEFGGTHRGKAAVVALMAKGVDLYRLPLSVATEEMIAERDWVCVQLAIEAKPAVGHPTATTTTSPSASATAARRRARVRRHEVRLGLLFGGG